MKSNTQIIDSKTQSSDQGIFIPEEVIANKIYFIRGQKVMLDSDLAKLYGVETFRLNEQVKRNTPRFPEDFMFQLSPNEWKSLTSQFAMSKKSRGGRRTLPNVFTEHGVLMLSSVLNSNQAIAVNIQIMRIFTKARQLLTDNNTVKLELSELKLALNKIAQKQDGHAKNIELLFTYIDHLQEKINEPKSEQRKSVGYKLKRDSAN